MADGSQRYMSLEDDEDSTQQSLAQEADGVLYDTQSESMPEYADSAEQNEVVSEAVKRIQQAKLYETLLSHSLFKPGSADPEIQNRVESEIHAFILNQLEILLGMKHERTQQTQPHFVLPFDEDQIKALTVLADKVLKRQILPSPTPTPAINQVEQAASQPEVRQIPAQSPTINQVEGPGLAQPQQVRRQMAQARPSQAKQPSQRSKRIVTANVSQVTPGKELSQAVSKRVPRARMPSAMQMNEMNAIQADRNSRTVSTITAHATGGAAPTSTAETGQALLNLLNKIEQSGGNR